MTRESAEMSVGSVRVWEVRTREEEVKEEREEEKVSGFDNLHDR